MIPDFNARTIDVLSRRAALRCSNPDCNKLTTGPNSVDTKATNIGEAAHIYGARPNAARYRPEMSDKERAAITNAMWLCSDCHGLVDKDPPRFSADLLLLWKEKHEAAVMNEIGKVGDQLRKAIVNRELEALGPLPYYAEELVREKPAHWEYLLTAELLDYYLKPVMRRARDLELSLVTKPRLILPDGEVPDWLSNKLEELLQVPKALQGCITELSVAWGPDGEPGDAALIQHVCKLMADAAGHLVVTAEDVRFTALPRELSGIASLLIEGCLYPLSEIPKLAQFIRSIFSSSSPSGTHAFELVVSLPDGWEERFHSEMKAAYSLYDPYS